MLHGEPQRAVGAADLFSCEECPGKRAQSRHHVALCGDSGGRGVVECDAGQRPRRVDGGECGHLDTVGVGIDDVQCDA
ncbi:Uncharacterised protein [Mycobacteroides abscessus subsp. abscessus]|nr:Uncharacterised protein [Mycobacteroides abscessus subsp. abscessus]